ncbi:MAG TPA: hypothetical protein VK915_14760 [Gaiellaceae bacterium]|nr:hypothetical protein [Gaiellaceae bacterium]
MSTPLRERPDAPLGTLIFRAGLLPAETIENALEEGVRTGKRLGEVLVDRGLLQDIDLARLLAGQKGLDFVALREQIVDSAAAQLFTAEQARLFHALPYAFEAGRPVVAIADPNDEILMRNIRETIGRPDVTYVVCTRSELAETLDAVYAGAREPAPLAAPPPASPPEPAPAPPYWSDRANGAWLSPVAPLPPAPAPARAPELRLPEPPREGPVAEPPAPVADLPPAPPPQAAPAPPPHAAPAPPEPLPQPAPELSSSALPPAAEQPAPEPPSPALPAAAEQPAPEPPSPALPPPAEQPAPEPPSPALPPPAKQPAPEPPSPALPAAAEGPAPSPAEGTAYRVGIRLTTGERVEAGAFADLDAAKQHAKNLMHQVAGAGEGDWPYVSGRFLKPDTIVSVDLAESGPNA